MQRCRENARGWGPRLLLSVGSGSWVRGERVRGPARRWLCQGSWALRWVEKLPRCTPGCGSRAANSPARSGAGAHAVSPGRLGLLVPYAECVPGVRLFEFSSQPRSHLCLRFIPLFGINCIRNGSFRGASASLPPRAALAGRPRLRSRVPPGRREPPSPFGDPRARSYPQPSLRQGHSWAGSGQSARLGTSVLARVALKARDGGGGLKTSPQSRAVACFLDRRRRQQGTLELNRCFFPLGKTERIGVGQVGFSLLPPSLCLPNQMPHGASHLEGNRVLWPHGSCLGAPGGTAPGFAEAAGPPNGDQIPLAANSRLSLLRSQGPGAAQGES